MEDFRDLAARTFCPFARKAKIWEGPKWDFAVDWDCNIDLQSRDLLEFVKVAERNNFHGYVAEIDVGDSGPSLKVVKEYFFKYLKSLASRDASCARSMSSDFSDLSWQFEFAEIKMFLNVFASCYKVSHSKRIDSGRIIYVFFQPEYSFDLCGISSESKFTKNNIRDAFAQNGMPYSGNLIDARNEANLYLFPEELNNPPVEWWT